MILKLNNISEKCVLHMNYTNSYCMYCLPFWHQHSMTNLKIKMNHRHEPTISNLQTGHLLALEDVTFVHINMQDLQKRWLLLHFWHWLTKFRLKECVLLLINFCAKMQAEEIYFHVSANILKLPTASQKIMLYIKFPPSCLKFTCQLSTLNYFPDYPNSFHNE